jgi:SHS2 domain-containing protein|tara:strand:+ start:48 stop:476 length:429 start_codon:yes stop_codon:yes gene_type:complete
MKKKKMSYRYLEHSTDAIIEVIAPNLTKAFEIVGKSVVQTILDDSKIEEINQKKIIVKGKDLHYLLYNWLEEIIILTITDGFAIKRFKLDVKKEPFVITAELFGEDIDIKKHGFKVEIKSPTFHEMEINEGIDVKMKYLLDL